MQTQTTKTRNLATEDRSHITITICVTKNFGQVRGCGQPFKNFPHV